jgi:hypothetical protein
MYKEWVFLFISRRISFLDGVPNMCAVGIGLCWSAGGFNKKEK